MRCLINMSHVSSYRYNTSNLQNLGDGLLANKTQNKSTNVNKILHLMHFLLK